MRMLFRTAISATVLPLLLAGPAVAAPRTATLEIKNASCVACAPIVKWSLSRVPGVKQVAVVERGGMATATVTFDDEKVTVDALVEATTNAGFPSSIRDVKSAAQ